MKKDYKRRIREWRQEVEEITKRCLMGGDILVHRQNGRMTYFHILLDGTPSSYFWRRVSQNNPNLRTVSDTQTEYSELIDEYRELYSKRHRIPINHLRWAEADEAFVS